MISRAHSDGWLDLDRDLTVTQADVDALRRLRADVPSWFSLDWRTLSELAGPGALGSPPLCPGHVGAVLPGIAAAFPRR